MSNGLIWRAIENEDKRFDRAFLYMRVHSSGSIKATGRSRFQCGQRNHRTNMPLVKGRSKCRRNTRKTGTTSECSQPQSEVPPPPYSPAADSHSQPRSPTPPLQHQEDAVSNASGDHNEDRDTHLPCSSIPKQ